MAVLACLLLVGCGPAAPAENVEDGVEQEFTDPADTTSQYRTWLPDDEPAGVLVVLDGDGQYGYEHPDDPYLLGGPEGVVAAGTRHGLAVVAVRTPDDDENPTWWEDGETNAAYLHELLAHLDDQISPTDSEVWLVGYSGGAQQITQTYLPLYSQELRYGGAVIFGGGGPPEVDAEPVPPKGDFPMHWHTGAQDTAENSDDSFDAVGDARAGARIYRDAGFEVTEEYPAGVGHALDGTFGRVIEEQLSGR